MYLKNEFYIKKKKTIFFLIKIKKTYFMPI